MQKLRISMAGARLVSNMKKIGFSKTGVIKPATTCIISEIRKKHKNAHDNSANAQFTDNGIQDNIFYHPFSESYKSGAKQYFISILQLPQFS
jgi:folylpolyglutamate synthase/dihydropteroate synthase